MHRFFGILFFLLSAALVATSAEDESRAPFPIERYIDDYALSEMLHFPFLTLANGQLTVIETPDEFIADSERLSSERSWFHGTTVSGTDTHYSGDKLNILINYHRYRTERSWFHSTTVSDTDMLYAGDRLNNPMNYGHHRNRIGRRGDVLGNVMYLMTEETGRWGHRFRAVFNGAPPPEAEAAARKTVDDFFVAWNAADNLAIWETVNFPHAFVLADGRTRVSREKSELSTDFDRMRRESGWHHSSLDSMETVLSSDDLVWFRIVFSRRHADGTAYLTVPADWFVTKQDGHWGIQTRSMMPPLEPAE